MCVVSFVVGITNYSEHFVSFPPLCLFLSSSLEAMAEARCPSVEFTGWNIDFSAMGRLFGLRQKLEESLLTDQVEGVRTQCSQEPESDSGGLGSTDREPGTASSHAERITTDQLVSEVGAARDECEVIFEQLADRQILRRRVGFIGRVIVALAQSVEWCTQATALLHTERDEEHMSESARRVLASRGELAGVSMLPENATLWLAQSSIAGIGRPSFWISSPFGGASGKANQFAQLTYKKMLSSKECAKRDGTAVKDIKTCLTEVLEAAPSIWGLLHVHHLGKSTFDYPSLESLAMARLDQAITMAFPKEFLRMIVRTTFELEQVMSSLRDRITAEDSRYGAAPEAVRSLVDLIAKTPDSPTAWSTVLELFYSETNKNIGRYEGASDNKCSQGTPFPDAYFTAASLLPDLLALFECTGKASDFLPEGETLADNLSNQLVKDFAKGFAQGDESTLLIAPQFEYAFRNMDPGSMLANTLTRLTEVNESAKSTVDLSETEEFRRFVAEKFGDGERTYCLPVDVLRRISTGDYQSML